MTGRSFRSPATGRSRHLADADPDRPEVGPTLSPALLARTARFRLSVALLLVVAVTSGLSLAVPTLFHYPAVTAGNLRGTCAVLLLVAVPSLAWSLRATARGSVHGLIVGMGATAYVAYDGVLLSFGAIFNRLFLLDVALLGLAASTLAVHVPEANRAELSSMLSRRGAQWIAAYRPIVPRYRPPSPTTASIGARVAIRISAARPTGSWPPMVSGAHGVAHSHDQLLSGGFQRVGRAGWRRATWTEPTAFPAAISMLTTPISATASTAQAVTARASSNAGTPARTVVSARAAPVLMWTHRAI
ncbi:MAG: hypothetical protein QOG20_5185 [Pseudonocardiales bacterium]|jgi:hypothetical protein|nr:hypothetical protein [Pseudonocardiales bacterium]